MIALSLVSFLNDTAGDMIIPILPIFIGSLGGSAEALGLIEGVADAAASLLQIGSGYLADRAGRFKRLTLIGYVIANALRPLLALTTGWPQVLAIRFGDRIGKGIRSAPRDALLAQATARALRGRAYGFHRAMDNAGAIAGPLIIYLMLAGGLSTRAVFAWSALPGALCVLLLAAAVRDLPGGERPPKMVLGLPPSPVYRRFLLAIFVFTLGSSSDAFLIWRAHELGVPLVVVPLLWIVLHVVKSSTSTWGGALSDRAGRRAPILGGWAIYAAAYLGFALVGSAWQIWPLFAAYGVFFGLTEGAEKALVVDLVPEHWRGRALGAYHAAVGVAALPASVVFGVVYQRAGPAAAFSMGAALAVIAALLLPRRLAAEPPA